ncbi:MAG: DNA repair protein RecN [Bacteroidota bacterium]
MLRSLYVKHYALIEEISVEFERGLNIITGETGAGKSILIDALSLLLGERASTEVIRKGAEKAIVEGTFAVAGSPKIQSLLKENDIELSEEMIVRREISAKGQSRCFINDSPVPLTLLKEAGDVLVDLHGQHDHQALLRPETHIDFLDDFGGDERLLTEYHQSYKKLSELFSKKHRLREQEQRLKEKKDLYEFQMKEIDAINPQAGEEETLEAELKILENAEKLHELTSQLSQLLYEGESSVHDNLVLAWKQIETLREIDQTFADIAGEAKSAEIIVEELSKFIQSYNAKIEFNPEKLEQIRERLGQFSLLKKKYGGTLESLLEHRRKIGDEFSLAENFEKELAAIDSAIMDERKTCSAAAQKLTEKRRESAKKIEKAIISALADLGIMNAKFSVRIGNVPMAMGSNNGSATASDAFVKIGKEFYEATSKGIDVVEFFISTNVGEDVKPLAKVASGGEISRVMLALKSALAASDKIPLLIFDEIDVGVSGRIGQAVGLSLKKLAGLHQIIAITHLPQIAGLADTHFAVEKIEDGKRTTTRLRRLDVEERVREVAKLMSGEKVTEAGLKSARELMGRK